jgi:hypothetical protein
MLTYPPLLFVNESPTEKINALFIKTLGWKSFFIFFLWKEESQQLIDSLDLHPVRESPGLTFQIKLSDISRMTKTCICLCIIEKKSNRQEQRLACISDHQIVSVLYQDLLLNYQSLMQMNRVDVLPLDQRFWGRDVKQTEVKWVFKNSFSGMMSIEEASGSFKQLTGCGLEGGLQERLWQKFWPPHLSFEKEWSLTILGCVILSVLEKPFCFRQKWLNQQKYSAWQYDCKHEKNSNVWGIL